MTRRGLSILELVLAAAIGVMVLITTMSLLSMLNRSDRLAASRNTQSSQMAASQTIFRRMFSSLVMANNTRVPPPQNTAQNPAADADIQLPPPRFILEPDPFLSYEASQSEAAPQRLILVLDRAAVPLDPENRQAIPGFASPAGVNNSTENGAVRGVLEFRPARLVRKKGSLQQQADEKGYVLQWRTLAPGVSPDDLSTRWINAQGSLARAAAQMHREDEPVVLMRDIKEFRWQVYRDRMLLEEYAGMRFSDLPAYVIVEIQTNTGIYASWLFEIGWSVGPERSPIVIAGTAPLAGDDEPAATVPLGDGR